MSTTNEEMSTEELADVVERRRRYVEQDLDAIGDRVSPARIRERTGERARRRMYDVRTTVMGSAESASSGASDVAGRAQAAEQQMEERVKGNPFGAGLVAFGIGYLIGSVLPGSRQERQLARKAEPMLTEVASEAAGVAHEVADDLKPAAKEEFGAVKDDAAGAASNVREQI